MSSRKPQLTAAQARNLAGGDAIEVIAEILSVIELAAKSGERELNSKAYRGKFAHIWNGPADRMSPEFKMRRSCILRLTALGYSISVHRKAGVENVHTIIRW